MELMQLRTKKRRGVFEVTMGQIIASMLMATFALTVVFYVGVHVGKKRVITAEQESQKLEEAKANLKIKTDNSPKVTSDLQKQPPYVIKSAVERLKVVTAKQDTDQKPKQETDNQPAKIYKEPSSKVTQSQTVKEPEVSKKSRYTVKVGTFSSYENAKKLSDSLESSGYEPQLIKGSNQGDTFYHVTVGDFDSIDKAKQYGDTLREKLPYINDYVIRTYNSNEQ
jgi:cell division septation protein DedD